MIESPAWPPKHKYGRKQTIQPTIVIEKTEISEHNDIIKEEDTE